MSVSKPERGRWRAALHGMLAGVLLAMLASGCGAVYHLHPNTGHAFNKVMRLHRSAPFPQPQMTGEDAEIALDNLAKASKAGDMKREASSVLLPLQR